MVSLLLCNFGSSFGLVPRCILCIVNVLVMRGSVKVFELFLYPYLNKEHDIMYKTDRPILLVRVFIKKYRKILTKFLFICCYQ